MSHGEIPLPEREQQRVLQLSAELEDLPSSNPITFDRLLDDNLVTRHTDLECGAMSLFRSELPPEMVEVHYFPDLFALTDVSAHLTEYLIDKTSDESDEVSQERKWNFNATYQINGNAFHLYTDETVSVLKTMSNVDASEIVYYFNPETALRFLVGVTLGAFRSGAVIDPEDIQRYQNNLPAKFMHCMHLIGSSYGEFKTASMSCLQLVEEDTGLLFTAAEYETPEKQSKGIQYRLIIRDENGQLTDTVVHHNDASVEAGGIRDDGTEWASNDRALERFAEKRPGVVEPEDMVFDSRFEDPTMVTTVFDEHTALLDYARISAATMTILNRILRDPRYVRMALDESLIGVDVEYLDDHSDVESGIIPDGKLGPSQEWL